MKFVGENGFSKEEQPVKKRFLQKINRWYVFLGIIICSAFTILYVYNVMYINKLMKEEQDLSKKYDSLRINNALLRTKLNQLRSPERIIKIATENFGMVKADEVPIILENPK